jgi:hypothetical protein
LKSFDSAGNHDSRSVAISFIGGYLTSKSLAPFLNSLNRDLVGSTHVICDQLKLKESPSRRDHSLRRTEDEHPRLEISPHFSETDERRERCSFYFLCFVILSI